MIVPLWHGAVNHARLKANNLIAAGFAVADWRFYSQLKGDLSVNFGDFPDAGVRHLLCGSYDFSGSLHGILHSDPPDGHADGNSGGVFVGAGASHGRSVPSGSIYTAGSSSFDAVSGTRIQYALFSASDSGAEISERQHPRFYCRLNRCLDSCSLSGCCMRS